MEPKDWISLAGIFSTAFTALVTLFLTHRRQRQQQERDDRIREEARAREDELRAKDRLPRVRANLDCRFYGPEMGRYIAEVAIVVDNIGNV